MFKRFISQFIIICYVHQVMIGSVIWANTVCIKPIVSSYGFELEVEGKDNFKASFAPDRQIPIEYSKSFTRHEDGIEWRQDGVIGKFDWQGNLVLEPLSSLSTQDLSTQESLDSPQDVQQLCHNFKNPSGSIILNEGLNFKSLTLDALKIINTGSSFIENLTLTQGSTFINAGNLTVHNAHLFDLVNQGSLEVINLNLNNSNFINNGQVLCSQESSFIQINSLTNNGLMAANKHLTLDVKEFNNLKELKTYDGLTTNNLNNQGTAHITKFDLKQDDKEFVNHGVLQLKQIVSLGKEKQKIINHSQLEILDSGKVKDFKGGELPKDQGGFAFGDIINQENATIGFGNGTYTTGIITNHGNYVVLPGQDAWNRDIINHGEIHSNNKHYKIDCTKGLFSKLGKVRVNGNLLIEVGDRFNVHDLLKNSEIKATKQVVVKGNRFEVNSELALTGSWRFELSNFLLRKDLKVNSLKIKNKVLGDIAVNILDLFETSLDESQYASFLVNGGKLKLKTKRFNNKFGYIFSKNRLSIIADEDIINGSKSEQAKDPKTGLYMMTGSVLASTEDVRIESLRANLLNNYGMIWSKKRLELKAEALMKNLTGCLKAEQSAKISAKKLLVTRDEEGRVRPWKGCYKNNHRGKWYHDCNCASDRDNTFETSEASVIDITNEEGIEGEGNLELNCKDVEILASNVYATGNITHLKNEIDSKTPTTSSFKLTSRNDCLSKIKSGSDIQIAADGISFSGSADCLNMTLDANKILLECLGARSKIAQRLNVDMTPYLLRACLQQKILKKNANGTLELAVPMSSQREHVPHIYIGERNQDLQLIAFATPEAVELAVRLLVLDLMKAAKLDSNLYQTLHQNAMAELQGEQLSEKDLEKQLKDKLSSYLLYRIQTIYDETKKPTHQEYKPILSLCMNDQDNLQSGEIRVGNRFRANAKDEFKVLSGVITANTNRIRARNIAFQTLVNRYNIGCGGYAEEFSQRATLRAHNSNIVRASELFESTGALFETGYIGFYEGKQVSKCAIAERLDVFETRNDGRTTRIETITQRAMPTEFVSNKDLIHKGSEIIHKGTRSKAVGSITYNADKLLQTTDQTVTSQTTQVTKHGNMWRDEKTHTNSAKVITLIPCQTHASQIYHKGDRHVAEGVYDKADKLHDMTKAGRETKTKYTQDVYDQSIKVESNFSTTLRGTVVTQDIKLTSRLDVNTIIRYNPSKMIFESDDSISGVELRDQHGKPLTIGKDFDVIPERELKTTYSNYGYTHQLIPTPVVIIAGMAAAYFTGGLFSNVYANAAMGFIAQRATTVMLSTGSVDSVIKSFNNDQCIKDLAISLSTVGIMDQLKLPNTKVIDKIQKGVVQTAVDTTLKVAIDKQSFDHAVTTSAKFGFANVVGSVIAGHIGGLYRDKEQNLDYLSHKLLHGVKGALEGFIIDPSLRGMVAGSVGSMAAEVYADDATYGLQKGEGLQNHVVEKIHEAEKKGKPLDPKEVQELNAKYISDTLQKSRIVAGITAAALQQDVSVAALSGGTSVEHNVIPGLIIGGILMYEAYDLYHTYKRDGVEAAVRKLAISGAIGFATAGVGKVFWIVAGQRCFTAIEAFTAYMQANPALRFTFNKIITPIAENYKKLDQAIEKGITKGWDKGKSYLEQKAIPQTGLSKFSSGNAKVVDAEGVTSYRPTPRQSEIDVTNSLGSEYKAQQSFKNGETAIYGTKGSVRPDAVNLIKNEAIEIKCYDLTNTNGLINNVAKQAIERQSHLPEGMVQRVIIDVRGQSMSAQQKVSIFKNIEEKSQGIITETQIKFKVK